MARLVTGSLLLVAIMSLSVAAGCQDAVEPEGIIFTSNRSGANAIYVMDLDSRVQRLTDDSTAFASVSHDGRRLAYTDERDGSIHVLDLESEESFPQRLTAADSIYRARPAWSPDGSTIAFMGLPYDEEGWGEDWRLYQMSADGTNETLLYAGEHSALNPAWAPDGRSIAFQASPRDDMSDVYVLELDGDGQAVAVVSDSALDGFPAWSPDGSKIAFESTRDGDYEIYIADTDGGNVVQLTDNDGFLDGAPFWSPDGERIFFHSDRDGNHEVYGMNADGSEPMRFTSDSARDMRPIWTPRLPAAAVSAHQPDSEAESGEADARGAQPAATEHTEPEPSGTESSGETGTLALKVADWVPPRAYHYGWWGAVPAGEGPSPTTDSTNADALALPPGTYDVYWKQDHSNPPVRLVSELDLAAGELATVEVNTGVRLQVADWVPARARNHGWWGAVRSGGDPEHDRIQWTNDSDRLLVPPGTYDVYWKQDHSNPPVRLVSELDLAAGELATVEVNTGVRLSFRGEVPELDDQWGFWGVIPPGADPTDPLYRSSDPARPLLVPSGRWDVVWKVDYEDQARSLADVTVSPARLVRVEFRAEK